MRIPTKAKIWGNGILLVGSGLTMLIWAGVTFKPNDVNSLGSDAIEQYVARHKAQQSEAVKALQRGSTEPAFVLLDDWQQVLKGDRLYPLKRQLYTELSIQLDTLGRVNEMKTVAEQWRAEDDRDIAARAYYWHALTKDPITKEAGVAGLTHELSNFPNSQTLRWFQEAAVLSTLSRADREEFWAVQQAKAEPAWQVFWDTGEGFYATQATSPIGPTREQDNEWSVTVEIPASSRNLRLDLPPDSRLRLSKLALQIGQDRTLLDATTLQLHMITAQGEWLQTTGGNDPYLAFSLAGLLTEESTLVSVKINFLLARGGVTRTTEAGE